jgi:pyruvate formate lyase activating enzyme
MIFGGLEKFSLIDYPGAISCIAYSVGCNFRCPYCHNPELVDETAENRFTEKELYVFLDSRTEMLDGVVITGGEPTMHSDLPNVLKMIKSKGYRVKLDSNGTNPDMLERIIAGGLADYIAMDIKAPLSKYNSVVGRPVDAAILRRSMDLIMSSGIEYEFRTTLIKMLVSPEDIQEIGREIAGAKKYYLQKFVPTKILNPQFIRKATYDDDELKHFQKILAPYVGYCGIR